MYECMKRTTLVLEDAILEGIREEAHAEGRDMSDLANEFLRLGLLGCRRKIRKSEPLPSFSMGRPTVNLADRDALEVLMEK